MYDAWQVLDTVNRTPWLFLALCGCAMIANYVWFIDAYRVSLRERIINIPLWCTFFWFAHDTSVVYRFDTWFNYYDHWFTKFWWIALVFTVSFEILFLIRAVRFGPKELWPGGGRAGFTALVLVGVVCFAIMWENVKGALGDPLYLFIFGMTIVSFPPLVVSHLMKRQHARGYTAVQMAAYTVMAVCYFVAVCTLLPHIFLTPLYLGLAVISAVGGIALTYVVYQMNHNGKLFGLRGEQPVPEAGDAAVPELAAP